MSHRRREADAPRSSYHVAPWPLLGVALTCLLAVGGCAGSKKAPETGGAESPRATVEAGGKGKSAAVEEGQDPAPAERAESDEAEGGTAPSEPGEKAAAAETPPKAAAKKPAPRPKPSGKARGHIEAGQKAFAAGDLKGAQTQFNAAIKADKNAYQAYFASGLVEQRMDRSAQAADAFKKALRIVPDYEPAISAYGVLLARQGSPEAALNFLQKKAREYPDRAAIITAMAEAKSVQGQSGEAQRLAQQALKIDPDFKPAMVTLARDHYRARRIDLALYALKGILDGYGKENPPRDKDNAEAHLIRGLIHSDRGMRGSAMEDLEEAVKLRPDFVDAHLVLATYMLEAGNAKGAVKHLEMAVRYDNDNVTAHLQLGDAYRLVDRVADARRELEWVLKADPQMAGAHYNLGLLFLLSKDVPGMSELDATQKAIEHFEAYKSRVGRGGPDDVDELLTRAKTKKALIEAKQAEGAS